MSDKLTSIDYLREHAHKLLYVSNLEEVANTKISETFKLLAEDAFKIIELLEKEQCKHASPEINEHPTT